MIAILHGRRFARAGIPRGVLVAVVASVLFSVLGAGPAAAADETRLTDSGKTFHRLVIGGDGDTVGEEREIESITKELATELSKPGRSAAGSPPVTVLNRPTDGAVIEWINAVKAKPGLGANDEVTIIFSGHGNYEYVRLNGITTTHGTLTANELAGALAGMPAGVTVLVILETCYGGSFIDNIGEDDRKKVIGTKGMCPFDPFLPIFDTFHDTFSEDVLEAIANDPSGLSGQELKDYLNGEGWDLGIPVLPDTKPRKGKSRCVCVRPSVQASSQGGEPGTLVTVSGDDFSSSGTATLTLYHSSGATTGLGTASLSGGSFSTEVTIPDVVEGAYLLLANDGTYQDYVEPFIVGSASGGGSSVPAASMIGLAVLAAMVVGLGSLRASRLGSRL